MNFAVETFALGIWLMGIHQNLLAFNGNACILGPSILESVLFASTTENSAFWNRSVLQRSIIRLPTLPVAGIYQREWPQLCEETTDLSDVMKLCKG